MFASTVVSRLAESNRVYLDNNASTAVDERVLSSVFEVYRDGPANSGSAHAVGQRAKSRVDDARERVAALVGARPREVVFTSGATEANNLAIKGIAAACAPGRRHVVTCETEHAAILGPVRKLERDGFRVSIVGALPSGQVDLDALTRAVGPDTALVSVMAVNNETGVLNPIRTVADVAHSMGASYHCDATQWLAWGPIDVEDLGIDLLSLSGHKIHGPQGVGALFVSRRLRDSLVPVVDGGGQETGLRSGTVNVAGTVGLGVAAAILIEEGAEASARVTALRQHFEAEVRAGVPTARINGSRAERAPGTTNLCFPAADAELVMTLMPDVIVSTGSACSSSIPEPSHVLLAMGLTREEAMQSLRVSLSRNTTAEDVAYGAARITQVVRNVQSRAGTAVAELVQ